MRKRFYAMVPARVREFHKDWRDAEHAAWLDAVLASAEQPNPGRFENRAVLAAALGRRRRAIDALFARGAIIPASDQDADAMPDELYVEGFDEMRTRRQRMEDRLVAAEQALRSGRRLDPAERMARSRARQTGRSVVPASYGPQPRDNGEETP